MNNKMQSNFKTYKQAIEKIDRNIIINELYFYDKNTQIIDKTDEFKSWVLTNSESNLQDFKNEFESTCGKKFFVDEENKIIKFSSKEELNLKFLFELIIKALFYKYGNKAIYYMPPKVPANPFYSLFIRMFLKILFE